MRKAAEEKALPDSAIRTGATRRWKKLKIRWEEKNGNEQAA